MWHFWFLWWLACSCGTATSCATSCTSIIFGLYCRRSQPKQRRNESFWQKLGDLGIRKPFRSKRGGRNHSFNCIPAITTIGAPLFLSDQECQSNAARTRALIPLILVCIIWSLALRLTSWSVLLSRIMLSSLCYWNLIFGCPRQIMNHNSENLKVIYTKCSMVLSIN